MTYAVSLLGMLLSFCARTPLFTERTPAGRGCMVILFYTLSFTINRHQDTEQLADLAKVVLFVCISHYIRKNKHTCPWEEEARTCWVLACYAPPLLSVALLQLILDTDAHVPKSKVVDEHIETWDVKDCV